MPPDLKPHISFKGMFNFSSISAWTRGSSGFYAENNDNSCNTGNKTWLDSEKCTKKWCSKYSGGNEYCDNNVRYEVSFYSPMHSIYLSTQNKINDYNLNNYLVSTKWCSNSKYNKNDVVPTCLSNKNKENCKTIFPNIDLTCDETDYINSTFGLLSEEEYYLVSNYTETTYYTNPGIFSLYGNVVSNGNEYGYDNTIEVTLDGRTTFGMDRRKRTNETQVYGKLKFRPAFTIKGSLKINGGDGSKNNPYTLTN